MGHEAAGDPRIPAYEHLLATPSPRDGMSGAKPWQVFWHSWFAGL